MISRLYVIHDGAVGAFGTPILHVNDVVAQRHLLEFLRSPDGQGSELARYAESYALYYLGSFDNASGVIVPERLPVLVVRVADLISQQ